MCGIAAIFAYGAGAGPVDAAELERVRDAMAKRGPDGAGLWVADDRRIGLGHRRLAIIDLRPEAAQPMAFAPEPGANATLRITFNGEIYNYEALRAELIQKGARFTTQSDTEVILQLYHREGPAMARRLRGMFAFAIWDDAKGSLFLARDPFGIKPLYYADDGKTFRLASSVKALRTSGRIGDAPDPAGHVGYFLMGSVPEPHTLYADIRALPAGSTLTIDRSGAKRLARYFDAPSILAEASDTASDVAAALRDSVRHHLVADVPVGVFLSSGLDSSVVVGLAAETHADLKTFTLGFNEFKGSDKDEVPLADLVAAHYATRHQTRYVTGADFAAGIDDVLDAMDQPTLDGVNVYFVAKAAAEGGLKVALSGLGGDEVFAGYSTFQEIPRLVGAIGAIPGASHWGKGFRVVAAPVARRFASPKHASIFEYGGSYAGAYLLRRGLFLPWEIPEILDPELARRGLSELSILTGLDDAARGQRTAVAKVAALETCFYLRNQLLRDADWAGMAHSLEIRTPFVDSVLFTALAGRIAAGTLTKAEMTRAPKAPLPDALIGRPKTGFSVPVRDWLSAADARERGFRGWAKKVYRAAWTGTSV
ncbi:MAG: asparagine synthase (glutamine-hydrolyzing) [Rhodospirillales bacterium]|nr:asparagine synthase (glutamine-hydrolyzing) [Rhodospirillales bacterium]